MSEKRKPCIKVVAEIRGKRYRVELYEASLWPEKFWRRDWGKFRIRINGKWALGDNVFTLSSVMAQLRGAISRKLNKQLSSQEGEKA